LLSKIFISFSNKIQYTVKHVRSTQGQRKIVKRNRHVRYSVLVLIYSHRKTPRQATSNVSISRITEKGKLELEAHF